MLEVSTPQRYGVALCHSLSVGLVRLFTPPPPPLKKRCILEGMVAVSDSDSEASACGQGTIGTNTNTVTTEAAPGEQTTESVATALATTDASHCGCASEAFSELGNAENPCDGEADEVVISDDDALALLPQEREDALQRNTHLMPVASIAENGQQEELTMPENSTIDRQLNACVEAADDVFAEFSFHAPMAFENADAKQSGADLPQRVRHCKQPAAAAAPAAADAAVASRKPKKLRAKFGTSDLGATMPAEDRLRILEKWQDLAGPAADPEALRFQLLVAAILHPKASETAVRGCMLRLHDWASNGSGDTLGADGVCGLTPARLATTAVEVWRGRGSPGH